jgi:hypothetical protein
VKRLNCTVLAGLILGAVAVVATTSSAFGDDDNVLRKGQKPEFIASTVPANGDVNPYGVWRVPRSVGNLHEGDILVSNFNNSAPPSGQQGTGSTIVAVTPGGGVSLFAQIDATKLPGPCPGGVGLTTALAVLKTGWVIVGSLPTTDGTSATAQAGCLIVLDALGNPVETFYGSLVNGPWDMAAVDGDDQAHIFITNVLNGTLAASPNSSVPGNVVNQGTVVRIDLGVSQKQMPWIESMTVIGSGFEERTDPAALVIGPTGVGLSPSCEEGDREDCRTIFGDDGGRVLYVADSLQNRIQAIPHALDRTTSAGEGVTFSSGGSLNGPLGLIVSEGGHVLTVDSDDGFITEMNRQGSQIATLLLDSTGTPPGAGALFGLAFNSDGQIVFVDDAANTLNLIH